MPRSFKICAPSPISRHCRERDSFRIGGARLRNLVRRHTRCAVAQVDEHATALGLEPAQHRVHRIGATEHVADDVRAVQPRQDVLSVADAAVHEGHVMDVVERRDVGVASKRADFALYRKFAGFA